MKAKKMYHAPMAERVVIDADISLVMMSLPPGDPPVSLPGSTFSSPTSLPSDFGSPVSDFHIEK